MSLNTPQPAPQRSEHPPVWELVDVDLDSLALQWSPAVIAQLRADFAERDRIGEERYGTRLRAFNGRDAMVDAYQELCDLVVYARQDLYEANDNGPSPKYALYWRLLHLCAEWRLAIGERPTR